MGWHTDGPVRAKIIGSDGLLAADVEAINGRNVQPVTQINRPGYFSSLIKSNITSTTGYMLISLAGGAPWPHATGGDHIDVIGVHVNFNPNTSFAGDVQIGILKNVDATNGDLNNFFTWHYERDQAYVANDYNLSVDFDTDNWIGPVVADDATWQTDVAISGPNDATFAPADGDVVVKVNVTAGAVDMSFMMEYDVSTA